ncbi:DUF1615 domain-containing protein [Snodgrassella sp. CFCC 13594]|uniref:DUF1615 domain-containing protein n=1 Tax=Snodgrassella sp. CFCC 13594 TaxID=1775559 RepID=UPI000A83CC7C|nr:DUF1615 domain-containing protein [Snodgrassella sp. CFCC 13594]
MKPLKCTVLWRRLLGVFGLSLALAGCGEQAIWSSGGDAPDDDSGVISVKQIAKLIPQRNHAIDKSSWANDISNIMDAENIAKTRENVCSVIAVVDQESNFVANPEVPGLGAKAIEAFNNEMPQKFNEQFGPTLGPAVARYFTFVLRNEPSPDNSFIKQMASVKTEQQLDVIYRQIYEYVTKQFYAVQLANAAKFMGEDIGERMNPITTIGSMQVQVQYALEHQRNKMEVNELRDYLYTQEGGLYYGIHRLMKYPAAYDKSIYRFADYNSGMYSSRNAAFQQDLNKLSGSQLPLDGDMLLYNKDGSIQTLPSQTETVINQVSADHNLGLKADQIHKDLVVEKQPEFEQTATYQKIAALYEAQFGKKPVYAIMPQVVISGPKLSRDFNTNWYASNVNRRYENCMRRAGVHHKKG